MFPVECRLLPGCRGIDDDTLEDEWLANTLWTNTRACHSSHNSS